jgi:hypothetical protein
MNILLWYLPFAIFTGACDLTVSEGEMQTRREWTTERPRGEQTPENHRQAAVTARKGGTIAPICVTQRVRAA